jgi:hypothetical protein
MSESWLAIPIVAISMPIILVPVILGLRHARIERECEHAERMKALELGRTLPGDEPWWSPARISVAIGAGVPIGVFLCALAANHQGPPHIGIWISASLVGIAGIAGGTTLAHHHFARAAAGSGGNDRFAKGPAYDPESFELAGHDR